MRYDSDAALGFASGVSRFIQNHAHGASSQLAEERGSFPNWAGSIWDSEHSSPMRNASCTTIAPTGSISIIAGCSSGIEPIYSLAYRRSALEGQEFIQIHPLLERIGRRDGWINDRVREALLEGVPAPAGLLTCERRSLLLGYKARACHPVDRILAEVPLMNAPLEQR